jgi:hypothetical protein
MNDVWTATPKLRALKAKYDRLDAIKAKSAPVVRAVRDQIKGRWNERLVVQMSNKDADNIREYLRECGGSTEGPIRMFGVPVHEFEGDGPPVVVTQ